MISRFIQFEWKQFFRSSYWQRGLGLNILMILLTLYLLLVFLSVGVSAYFLLKNIYPDKDPLVIVNSYLAFWFLWDLIIRYFSQKIPEMEIRPFLNLPLPKRKIAQYILLKSALSPFVWLPVLMFGSFAAVLYYKNYNPTLVTAWLVAVLGLTLANNYLNFIINKNKKALIVIAFLLGVTTGLNYFKIVDIQGFVANGFNLLQTKTWLSVLAVSWALLMLFFAYKHILKHLYLDALLQTQSQKIDTVELSFTNRLGELGAYYKNDLRSLWRNKRTKGFVYNILLAPFIGLFYIKFMRSDSHEDLLMNFTTAVFFITILLNTSYGQFIPSWDSAHYPFIMSQNINLKKYLKSKYLLLTTFSILLFVFSTPYLYFGWEFLAILFAFTVFVIGIINPVLLWNGAYNTKRIDINKKSFGNSQGFSARNMVVTMIFSVIPMIAFMFLFKLISFNFAIVSFTVIGIIGILLRNYFLDKITKLYIKRKYKTLHGFKQLN